MPKGPAYRIRKIYKSSFELSANMYGYYELYFAAVMFKHFFDWRVCALIYIDPFETGYGEFFRA